MFTTQVRHEKRQAARGTTRATFLSRSKIIMSSSRSPRVFLLLSFRFHDCRRDGETRNLVPSTNERNVPSGRRESPAHVAGPRPEYSIPYITPGPPDDIVAPKSPVVAVRAGRTLDSTIRCCEHNINPAEVYRDEHRASKFVHTAFILIISFSLSSKLFFFSLG
ncbi:hypothetical protein ALC62_02667 [Cyphomyrmex costatus]|uniref:Uncharacterized protein n=1 Tax=Cyphomyrmex costatus TaxID=456900 RepID=A0A195D084_9HYME|nr:hypothetical protein ALC62_02667 [Cyphomyrmex costatus]